jgi:hypothetical protein
MAGSAAVSIFLKHGEGKPIGGIIEQLASDEAAGVVVFAEVVAADR